MLSSRSRTRKPTRFSGHACAIVCFLPCRVLLSNSSLKRTLCLRLSARLRHVLAHSRRDLGGKLLKLLQAVSGGPVDESIHADLHSQARQFIHPVVHWTDQHTLGGTLDDLAHDVIDPASLPGLASGGQRGIVDTLLHLREPL